ncbi:ABC transporter ATP-binding protein [Aestuariibius sp. HNIBRBA575]|uniref:ABC transporter ATP-binding protein n=1 Tax=Aestuariibius sp. HNIBRBA575 TaxID=3233343 RepID=UPI0034A11DD6
MSGKHLFSWLWRAYLRPHWPWLGVAGLMMMMEGVVPAILSWAMGPLFDDVFIGGNQGAMVWVGLTIMIAFVLRGLSSVAQKVVVTRISQRTAGQIRGDLLRHLMRLDTQFHQENPPGALIEKVQGDVEAVNRVWSAIVTGLGRDAVSVIALFGVTLYIDWRWTLVALIGIPLLVAPSYLIQTYVRRRARDARALASRMSTRLDEVFHGITPIKLNALEEYQAQRYETLIDDRVNAEVRNVFGQSMIPALIDVMAGLGFVGVLFLGGAQIAEGEKTVGEFMSFFTAMSLTFEPLRRLGGVTGVLQTAAASMERVYHLLHRVPVQKGPVGTALPAPSMTQAPEIVLDNVTLSYGDFPVLRGTSFVAEAGKTTALVGASGAGKSTIFNLLTRLSEPQSGDVTIAGIPNNAMQLADLRGLFSVVSQDAALFDETLRDNILLGRDDVSDEELNDVLQSAHVTDFLAKMPDGLNSSAGPRGSNLSGGQRQRIAIARALLRDTPILLLDEATSALDTKSEAIVQDALERLSKGRTTLVIAHRLSTIRNADKIVVMDQGRVVEQGRHDDLLAQGGIYAGLYSLQFRGEDT